MLLLTPQKRVYINESILLLNFHNIDLQITTGHGDKILGIIIDQNLQCEIILKGGNKCVIG